MYQVFRNMTADMARMQDAIHMITTARDRMNSEHGANYAVSVAVGGDPSAVSLTSPFETLGEYEAVRAAAAQDPVIQSLIRMSGDVLTSVQDTIGQVVKPSAPRGSFATVSQAMMHMPAVVDAIGFAGEVADFVEQKTGNGVGVMTAMTGNRAGLLWIGFAESLDQVAKDSQTLETDPDYLAFFARSENLFVPGTLEDSIWQILP
jgi:hypothetical protein